MFFNDISKDYIQDYKLSAMLQKMKFTHFLIICDKYSIINNRHNRDQDLFFSVLQYLLFTDIKILDFSLIHSI